MRESERGDANNRSAPAPVAPAAAHAADKVKVGVFPVSSSLPYFIARDLGYFTLSRNLSSTALILSGDSQCKRCSPGNTITSVCGATVLPQFCAAAAQPV